MKLKKFIKHIDSDLTVKLFIGDGNFACWSGSALFLQVASDNNLDRETFLKECEQDEDMDAVQSVYSAMLYIDYDLDTTSNYEAATITTEENNYGRTVPMLKIWIKKRK